MRRAIKDRDRMQDELATTSAKTQIAKQVPIATFYHLERHPSNVRAAEAAVQEPLKSNLRNYIKAVFDQVRQSAKAYQLNGDGDI